ncbi:hypothetical protein PGB90_004791 [Kerria lacca]
MPSFELNTNVSKHKVTPEFLKNLSKLVASTLGKPESYVTVSIKPDQYIIWGGTDEPCGFASLMSIGQLGIEQNKKHSAVISDYINKQLGIPPNRCYINFVDSRPSMVGYNGSTFHDILGGN